MQESSSAPLRVRIEGALKWACTESALASKGFDWKFKVQISQSYWIKGLLVTPAYSLEDALLALQRLAPYRGYLLPGTGMNQYTRFPKEGLSESESRWCEL